MSIAVMAEALFHHEFSSKDRRVDNRSTNQKYKNTLTNEKR